MRVTLYVVQPHHAARQRGQSIQRPLQVEACVHLNVGSRGCFGEREKLFHISASDCFPSFYGPEYNTVSVCVTARFARGSIPARNGYS